MMIHQQTTLRRIIVEGFDQVGFYESRLARILLLLILIGTCELTCVPTRAQESEPVAKRVAELNDEYYEMYCSVLDTFIDHLKQDNASHGVMIVYGPEGNLRGTRRRLLQDVTGYMKAVGGSASDRVTTVDGGVSNHAPWTTTELWVVPPGAKMPEAVKRPAPTSDFSGKVGTMIGVDVDEYSPSSYGASIPAFAQILRRQPNSVGYLVVHQDADHLSGTWPRIAKYAIKILKIYGVDPTRVKIIHGKAAAHQIEDLWVLSKGEHLPPVN